MQSRNDIVKALDKIRDHLYLGSGYHVIRDYLNPAQVEYHPCLLARPAQPSGGKYIKKEHLRVGCPDLSHRSPERDRHFGFLWNKPLDPFTYTTAWRLQALRN